MPPLPAGFTPKTYNGPSTQDVLAKRQKYMLGAFGTLYKEPIHLTSGYKQYLFDAKGDRYLDMFGCIVTVGCGHSHPRITKRVAEVCETINHTSLVFVNNTVGDYCEALAKTLPGDDWQIYMCNSGSEATDFTMILSRLHTGNHQIFALRNGYHGLAEGARGLVSVKGWKHALPGPTSVTRAQCPGIYRGILGTEEKDLDRYINDLETQILEETPGKVAGMFVERIQGAGGCNELIKGYQRRSFEVMRKYGGLGIADEVQSGFGRLGKKFWGFEMDDAQPDIVNMAKSAGNGWPIGICAMKKNIAECLKGVAIVNTFGGNAMTAAVAHETLKIIQEEKLQENSDVVGTHIKDGVTKLMAKHPGIGHVRGYGLMLGIELVNNRETKEPAAQLTLNVMEHLKAHKIIIGKGGPFGNCLRMAPPMCLTKADADYFLDCFDDALTKEKM